MKNRTRPHIEALLRLARDAKDWESATACRILLESTSSHKSREAATVKVELFAERMMRVL